MKKSHVFLLAIALWLTACAAPATEPPDALQKIRLPMGYIPNIQYAPFYVAVEKGYFAEAGFEIEFDYSFETVGVKSVGAGEVPFALVSGEEVLLARAQDIPVVYVTAWFQQYPVAVVARADSGIQGVADLSGKRVGLPGLFGANYIGLRALLSQAGIPEADLTLDSIGFNQVEALLAGQEDAIVGYFSNEPIQLRAQGLDVVEIRVADFVTLAANGIITNEAAIAENPEMVRAFVGAFLRGLADTLTNPEEAYTISLAYVEGLVADDPVQMEVLIASIDFWRAETPGHADPAAWENMQALLLDMGLLAEPLDLDAAFTNEFIP